MAHEQAAHYGNLLEVVCRGEGANVAAAVKLVYELSSDVASIASAAMLTELCVVAGAMPTEALEGQDCAVNERLTLELVDLVQALPEGWRLCLRLLRFCPALGREQTAGLLGRVAVAGSGSTEREALEVWRLCEEEGLAAEALSVCCVRANHHRRQRRLGAAAAWLLRARDFGRLERLFRDTFASTAEALEGYLRSLREGSGGAGQGASNGHSSPSAGGLQVVEERLQEFQTLSDALAGSPLLTGEGMEDEVGIVDSTRFISLYYLFASQLVLVTRHRIDSAAPTPTLDELHAVVGALDAALQCAAMGAWPHLLGASLPLLQADLVLEGDSAPGAPHSHPVPPLFTSATLVLLLKRLETLLMSHRGEAFFTPSTGSASPLPKLDQETLETLRLAIAARASDAFIAENRVRYEKASGTLDAELNTTVGALSLQPLDEVDPPLFSLSASQLADPLTIGL